MGLPLIDPLQVQTLLDVALHALGAVFLHLLGNVSIYSQGKCRCRTPKIILDSLNVIPSPRGRYGERVP